MRRHIPTTSMLLCFEAAARFGSFARAANELSLTSSAVSRSIQTLEDFLGLPLFERQRQRVFLNEAGQGYLKSVTEVLEQLEADTALTIARAQRDPALKLATFPTFGSRWLMPRLPDFAQAHPDVVLDLTTTGVIPFDVHTGEIDVAIQYGQNLWRNTHTVKLWEERLIAIVPPGLDMPDRPEPAWIASQRLLSLKTRPQDWAIWFEHRKAPAPEGHTGPIFETFGMLIGAVRAGLGVALVPELYVKDELTSGSLVPASGPAVTSGLAFYAVCDRARKNEPSIAVFLDWLHSCADDDRLQ